MNQIIVFYRKKSKYIFLLIISLIILFGIVIYFGFNYFFDYSKKLKYIKYNSDYDVSKLYANTNSLDILPNNITENTLSSNVFNIMGIISCDKIKLCLPIISNCNDELLKIAPCRIEGPNNVNEVGNLCIIAHNYNDSRFFSNIHKLINGDTILIYNTNGKVLEYTVFDKYEINPSDLSVYSQVSPNSKEITLITCNNLTGDRLIVKARNK